MTKLGQGAIFLLSDNQNNQNILGQDPPNFLVLDTVYDNCTV